MELELLRKSKIEEISAKLGTFDIASIEDRTGSQKKLYLIVFLTNKIHQKMSESDKSFTQRKMG